MKLCSALCAVQNRFGTDDNPREIARFLIAPAEVVIRAADDRRYMVRQGAGGALRVAPIPKLAQFQPYILTLTSDRTYPNTTYPIT